MHHYFNGHTGLEYERTSRLFYFALNTDPQKRPKINFVLTLVKLNYNIHRYFNLDNLSFSLMPP